jgi:hypothetical protein
MKSINLFLLIISCSFGYAQGVSFKELRLKPNARYSNVTYSTIVYPIVVTKNPVVDKMINDEIKAQLLEIDEKGISARKVLIERINEGLINLSYRVSFKKNSILSMSITSEGCAAYCSSSDAYFNFDLKTGKLIGISSIIDETQIDSLKTLVQNDKRKALGEYKQEQILETSNGQIDSTDYHWIGDYVDENCLDYIDIRNFSLSDSAIEFIDPCVFPHVIRSQEPAYRLIYSYKFLSEFLKPGFKSRLR